MHALRMLPSAGGALLSACLMLAAGAAAAQPIECDATYTIAPGDTLGKIAARVGLAPVDRIIDWIKRANPETISSTDLIFVGDELYIPCGDDSAGAEAADTDTAAAETATFQTAAEEPAAAEMSPLDMAGPTRSPEFAFPPREALGLPAAEVQAAAEAPIVGGRASRIFSGPGQFPPQFFGAYAIVAFKSEPLESDEEEFARYHAICEAYVRSIPPASDDLDQRRSELVTVWPMKTDGGALRAMDAPRDRKCEVAARSYGIDMALDAIRDARTASPGLRQDFAERDGPFLLAWNPASMKGDADALILRMDLSWVQTAGQAKQAFEFWVQRIETNTDLWLDDWETRPIDQIVANTADNWGQAILDSIAFIIGTDG